jgi:hypothetical protein
MIQGLRFVIIPKNQPTYNWKPYNNKKEFSYETIKI